jgi:hypothetical protein
MLTLLLAALAAFGVDTVDVPVGSPLVDMHAWRPYRGRMEVVQITDGKVTPVFQAALNTVFRDSAGEPLMYMRSWSNIPGSSDSGLLVFNRQTLAPRQVDSLHVHQRTPAFLAGAADLVVEVLPRRTDVVYRVALWQPGSDSTEIHLYRTTGREDVRVHGTLYHAWVVEDRLARTHALASRLWIIKEPPYMVRLLAFNVPKAGSEVRVEQQLTPGPAN